MSLTTLTTPYLLPWWIRTLPGVLNIHKKDKNHDLSPDPRYHANGQQVYRIKWRDRTGRRWVCHKRDYACMEMVALIYDVCIYTDWWSDDVQDFWKECETWNHKTQFIPAEIEFDTLTPYSLNLLLIRKCLCTKSWVWRAVWGETFPHGSVRGWGWNSLALLDPDPLLLISTFECGFTVIFVFFCLKRNFFPSVIKNFSKMICNSEYFINFVLGNHSEILKFHCYYQQQSY